MRADSVAEGSGRRLSAAARLSAGAAGGVKSRTRAPRPGAASAVGSSLLPSLLAGLLRAENLRVFDAGPDQQAVAARAHGPALPNLRLEVRAAPVADLHVAPFLFGGWFCHSP